MGPQRLSEAIRIRLTFSEAVEVEGSPRLKIDMDPAHWGEKWAAYESGSGTEHLTYALTVVEPNESTKGIAVLGNTLRLNGGTIRSAATGADAALAHAGLDPDPDHQVDWQQRSSGPNAPSATGVAVSSRPADGDTYGPDETIRVTLTFSEAVEVEGSPRLKIDMDPADWGEKWAAYEGGCGTEHLTFDHTVVEPNESAKGIAVLTNTLRLNGGTIRSAVTDADADLSHDGRDHDPAHKVDWQVAPSGGGENTPATGAPTIAGTAQVGETLTASTADIADADGLSGAMFSFQWVLSADGADTDIAGATGASYVLADADGEAAIKVRASFTDDAGNREEPTSAATARVVARSNTPATGAPAIDGEAQAGKTLRASTADIADADGLSGTMFSFQWVSSADGSDTDIAGATGASYVLGDSDVGAAIKVRASFTADAGNHEELTNAATATVEPRPLTVEFQGMPVEHDARHVFSFELVFSENFPGRFPYKTLRDSAFTVANGRVRGAERVVKGENRRWKITVRPSSNDDVTITLPAGAASTESGRPLSNSPSARVAGPVGISVADARVEEGASAMLAFAVTLSRVATRGFSVDYATSDGSARAGEDYTAASGTLSFQAGDSSGTVEVAVLDDAHDEGEETLTLTLSNASGPW